MFAKVSAVFALLAVAACSSGSNDDFAFSSSEIGTCKEVDEEAVEHACLHGSAGPFRDVTASLSSPPDVSQEHRGYRVTLAPVEGASGRARSKQPLPEGPLFGGAVSFVPDEAGEFAIYTSAAVPEIGITGAKGTTIAAECSTAVPTSLCGSLRQLRVFDLEAGSPVTITFQASTTDKVLLVIEHMEHDDHEH